MVIWIGKGVMGSPLDLPDPFPLHSELEKGSFQISVKGNEILSDSIIILRLLFEFYFPSRVNSRQEPSNASLIVESCPQSHFLQFLPIASRILTFSPVEFITSSSATL